MGHGSESGFKAAIWSNEKIEVQGLDFLTTMILAMYVHHLKPRMWKRDLKAVSRNCFLDQGQVWCSWFACMVDDEVWLGLHLAAPFGWVSSCFSFHRLGEFPVAVMIRLFKAPTGRYVDDFYGAGRFDVRWIGGRCMDVIMDLFGFPMGPRKFEDDREEMVFLGHEVHVDDDIEVATRRVEVDKVVRWG